MKKIFKNTKHAIFTLAIIFASLAFTQSAHADTVVSTYSCPNDSAGGNITVTANLSGSAVYQPDSSFSITTVSMLSYPCAGVRTISVTAQNNGAGPSYTLIPSQIITQGQQIGPISPFSPFTAPSSPGAYNVTFSTNVVESIQLTAAYHTYAVGGFPGGFYQSTAINSSSSPMYGSHSGNSFNNQSMGGNGPLYVTVYDATPQSSTVKVYTGSTLIGCTPIIDRATFVSPTTYYFGRSPNDSILITATTPLTFVSGLEPGSDCR